MTEQDSNGSTGREGGLRSGYSDEYTPLGGYAALLAVWSTIYGGALAAAAATHRLPERLDPRDVVLLGVATHKLTRIATKDWVTAPVRAPFVRYQGSGGGGEVEERARGRGLRKAIGDLLTCPFCTGPWVAGALVAGLIARPRVTRVVAGGFAAVALSDWLHNAYEGLEKLKG